MHAIMTDSAHHHSRRPWTLWGFSLVIQLIGVYNLLLALAHIRHAEMYRALGVSYAPLVRAALAGTWGGIFLLAGVALAFRRRWARRWIVVILSNYGMFGVLWLIVFARSDFARQRVVFQAVVTAVLVVLAAGIMRWRRVRAVFE